MLGAEPDDQCWWCKHFVFGSKAVPTIIKCRKNNFKRRDMRTMTDKQRSPEALHDLFLKANDCNDYQFVNS